MVFFESIPDMFEEKRVVVVDGEEQEKEDWI